MVVRANKYDREHRRPYLDLRLAGHHQRSRIQPFLPRQLSTVSRAISIYYQGHASPGVYCARVSRRPADRRASEQFPPRAARPSGLSSYPHPWLMPNFWQFPTVSMGLGPINAIYQARFLALSGKPRPPAKNRSQGLRVSVAMARWMSPNRPARCTLPLAKSSTT